MLLRVLGPLEVLQDDQPLRLGGAKERTLLAVLAVHANSVVSEASLIEALWGDEPPRTATKTLQNYVLRLRKVLERGRVLAAAEAPNPIPRGALEAAKVPSSADISIETRPPGYGLRLTSEAYDVFRVERLVASAREAVESADPARAAKLLGDALGHWHGRALEEFANEPFAVAEAARLEELRQVVVEDRLQAELDLGRHHECIAELEALVADHPLRERLWEQLMLALYRSRRQADALRAYQRARSTLVEELGIEPGVALRQLEAAIIAQSPALHLRPAPPSLPARSPHSALASGVTDEEDSKTRGAPRQPSSSAPPRPLPPGLAPEPGARFVGRGRELEALMRAWRDAVGGRRRVVCVGGEAGIGKTTIARCLARAAVEAGGLVLYGRCEEDLSVPYQPLVDALGWYSANASRPELVERVGPIAGELARLVPQLQARLPGQSPVTPLRADPETERYRLFDAVSAWLRNCACAQPTLVVFDDLHWAAKPTLLLLRHLLSSLGTVPLMVVTTYRDTELRSGQPLLDFLADLRRIPDVDRMTLGGLGTDDVVTLVAESIGRDLDEAGRALAVAIHGETEGNPFFVGELLRHLAESGAVDVRGHGPTEWQVEKLGVPEGVKEIVQRRLSRLSDAANRALVCAAVIGSSFELPVLFAVANLDEEALLDALDEAAGAGLISEVVSDAVPSYRFAHSLVRAAVYDSLSRARRIRLHRVVGEALEARLAGRLDEHLPALAHHFVTASPGGEVAKAIDYARRAGDRALVQLAHDQAKDWYRQALELLDGSQHDGCQRSDLLLSLGEAQRRAGEPEYRSTLLEAAHLAEACGDSARLAAAALANSRAVFSNVGEVDAERVEVLEAALSGTDPSDSPTRALLLAHLAGELVFSGEWDRRCQLSDQSLAMARRLGDPVTLAHVLHQRHDTIWHASTLSDRLALAEELEHLSLGLADAQWAFKAALVGIAPAFEAGDLALVDRRLVSAHRLACELRQPTLRWFVDIQQANRTMVAGRLDEGERLAHEALSLGLEAGQPDAEVVFGSQVFLLRLLQGRLEELETLVAEEAARRPSVPAWQAALAWVYCELGWPGRARPIVEPLAQAEFASLPYDLTWLSGMVTLADVFADLEDAERAEALYRLLSPYASQFAAAGPTWFGSVARPLGRLAAVLKRWDAADLHFSAAERAHRRLPAPLWLARTQLDWATARRARGDAGDEEQAGRLLEHALATVSFLEVPSFERRLLVCLGRG